ncbi:hypothetical protein KIN20_017807 [Parelaphostrongylus tenuis]|uniref:Uncharacterized protein n=1 Tax=Parelaphostrongylus tenuis TaxID=148309 RepID=A0AAD5MJ06_PARTN|nr:hypothetical protein KIN20_017807 [Parelaphostrongylus tenuis]
MSSLLAIISIALECGVIPAGQASTWIFIVNGFTLSVAMVYTGDSTISTQPFGIATNKRGAQTLVNRLVMQVVLDALERQARSAFLPDAVISTILGQLNTAKIPMANWTRMMWQGVVSREVRMLASTPLGSNFFSASAVVSEN